MGGGDEMDLKAWAQQNIQFVGNSYTNKSSRNQRIPEIIVNHISEVPCPA